MNAHTTLYAVYANAAPTAKHVAGFTSITRTNDGTKISFQAIASGDTAGIVYSTSATGNALEIGGTGVTNVAAEKLTDSTTTMPKSVIDGNNCWILQITPDNASTVYHARAYVTVGSETTYGDEKTVKLSDLESGISLIANPGSIDPETDLDKALEGLKIYTVTFEPNGGDGATMTQAFISSQSATLHANTFTREGYTFNGWSTASVGKKSCARPSTAFCLIATGLLCLWHDPTWGCLAQFLFFALNTRHILAWLGYVLILMQFHINSTLRYNFGEVLLCKRLYNGNLRVPRLMELRYI